MKRALVIFLILLVFVIGFIAPRVPRIWQPVPRDVEICVTPSPEFATVPWQLYVGDLTIFHQSSQNPGGWVGYPLAEGTGTLCTTLQTKKGHEIGLNGAIDIDGDGVFGESGDIWIWMVDKVNTTSVTIDGKDITSQVVNISWFVGFSSGADGHYKIPS